MHPPCSLDTAPSISIYFSLYKILLIEENFNSLEDCKRQLEQFFAQRDKKFWEDEIMKLPEKRQRVVEQNGEQVVHKGSW